MKLYQILDERATVHRVNNESEADYLQNVTDLLADKLGISDREITVNFNPPQELLKKLGDRKFQGATIGLNNSPDKIFVLINQHLSTGEKVATLSHEMVHAKQMADGRLAMMLSKDGSVHMEWEGESFEFKGYSNSAPWEIEATTQEKSLRQFVIDNIRKACTCAVGYMQLRFNPASTFLLFSEEVLCTARSWN